MKEKAARHIFAAGGHPTASRIARNPCVCFSSSLTLSIFTDARPDGPIP